MKVCALSLSDSEHSRASRIAKGHLVHFVILMMSWAAFQEATHGTCVGQSHTAPTAIAMFTKTDASATANRLEFRQQLRRTATRPNVRKKSCGIRYADFQGSFVDDQKCEKIARIHTLEVLVLVCTRITDSGLKPLRRLQRLRELDLRGTRISDNAVLHIIRIRSLRTVDVRGTCMTANGVARLRAARPGLFVLFNPNCRRRLVVPVTR